jgi:hypothetical protein
VADTSQTRQPSEPRQRRQKKRGTEVVSDMLRSLAVVGVVIVPLWLLIPHHSKQKVTVIDYSAALSQARRLSPQPLLAPAGLPAGWRVTSVSTAGGGGKPVVFHLGYVTPQTQYASLEESTDPAFVRTLEGKAPVPLASVDVHGVAWRQVRGSDGRLALVSPQQPLVVVVKGTGTLAELTTLASSLR